MKDLINLSNLNATYIKLSIASIVFLSLIFAVKWILKRVIKKLNPKDEKRAYELYSFVRIVANILIVLGFLVIWGGHVQNIITLISFLSAAIALAIRDIILNWFCGLYIKVHKPFKVEDRIEVDGIMGDVIDESLFSFDVLEVSNKDEFGQSTGVIISFPNSVVFSGSIKNLTRSFKYVWNELEVEIDLDSDLQLAKKTLYKIINDIDIVKSIPRKMKNQINEINTSYRIYYNNYDPIIYTKIGKSRITLTLRYLMHPKKARFVASTIWNRIYDAYKKGDIILYRDSE